MLTLNFSLARTIVAGIIVVTALCSTAHAGSFSVSPVRIELTAKRPYAVMQISNLSDEFTILQVHVVRWSSEGEREVQVATDDLLLNPPIFKLEPRQRQSIRLGLRQPNTGFAQVAYRVIVEEVPQPPPPGFQGLQTILRISIPVFATPSMPVAPKLTWRAEYTEQGALKITAVNEGSAHSQITTMRITASDEAQSVSRSAREYVLPGQIRTWLVEAPRLQGASSIKITATTDHGELHEVLVPSAR